MADSEMPILGVRVRALDTATLVMTGADGQYALRLSPGTHQLEFTHGGYEPLTMVAIVGRYGNTVVDVDLVPLPVSLTPVRVSTIGNKGAANRDRQLLSRVAPMRNASGGLEWSRTALYTTPQLDHPDVTRLLGSVAATAAPSESPSSLHVGGGSADQTVVLLDGIPIENAVHSGWFTSSIAPIAVDRVTLYADHIPARFGGRLSGVAELQTWDPLVRELRARESRTRDTSNMARDAKDAVDDVVDDEPAADEPFLSGTVSNGGVGIAVSGTSLTHGVSGLVSLRHSMRGMHHFWPSNRLRYRGTFSGWFDGLTHASARVAGGILSSTGVYSHDGLPFNEVTSLDGVAGFEWISTGIGATWTRPLHAPGLRDITLRSWRSSSNVVNSWATTAESRVYAGDRLIRHGGSVDVSAGQGAFVLHAGEFMERLIAQYASSHGAIIAQADSTTQTSTGTSDFDGAETEATAYAEAQWSLSERWSFMPGIRILHRRRSSETHMRVEPRIGVGFVPGSRVRFAAYYDETSQAVQSLRNEETNFDGIVGINVFSVHNGNIPVATASTVSATMTAEPFGHTVVTVGAYDRTLRKILVAPQSGNAPFVSDAIAVGNARTHGAYSTLTYATTKVTIEGNVRLMATRYHPTSSDAYQPSFAPTRFASVAVGWRASRWTDLRATAVGIDGRRSPFTITAFSAGIDDDLGRPHGSYGSAQTIDPGSEALPAYATVNVGISHRLPFGDGAQGLSAPVRLFGAVDNLFNTANIFGVGYSSGANALPAPGSPISAPIRYRPRAALIGLDWQW